MPTEFELFYQTLEHEKIKYHENSLVPLQYYTQNYEEFFSQIKLYSHTNKISQFIVVHDGQFKKTSLENSTNIHEFLSRHSHLNCEYINLSELCQVSPNEIHASEFYLQKLIDILAPYPENYGFIALGSGSITDLLKHALFILNKQNAFFISIPTATTVTAFTSAFSVVDIAGAKRTRTSKNINATFWIEPLLKAAPISLTRAGFGDLLARFVAYGDWYLGSCLNMFDNYDEIALRLMQPFSSFLKCESVRATKNENYLINNMNLLAQTLAMAGVSMSICNQTTPLSGYEHVVSHALDFLRLTSNRKLVLHGEQVALSVKSSALSYEWLFEQQEFDPKNLRSLNEKEARSVVQKLLAIAPFMDDEKRNTSHFCDIFLKDYLEKNEKWNKARNHFAEFNALWKNEPMQNKRHLQQLVLPADEIEKILNYIDLPSFPESTVPTTTAMEFRWALRFAPFVRSRFCLADFIFWIGEDPCSIAAM